jgi:hypothetical protein
MQMHRFHCFMRGAGRTISDYVSETKPIDGKHSASLCGLAFDFGGK